MTRLLFALLTLFFLNGTAIGQYNAFSPTSPAAETAPFCTMLSGEYTPIVLNNTLRRAGIFGMDGVASIQVATWRPPVSLPYENHTARFYEGD